MKVPLTVQYLLQLLVAQDRVVEEYKRSNLLLRQMLEELVGEKGEASGARSGENQTGKEAAG